MPFYSSYFQFPLCPPSDIVSEKNARIDYSLPSCEKIGNSTPPHEIRQALAKVPIMMSVTRDADASWDE
jgi:hypothetical protein